MVEDVEGLELKLGLDAFGNSEVFEERGVGEVITWPAEDVAANVADGAEGRTLKWSMCCSR